MKIYIFSLQWEKKQFGGKDAPKWRNLVESEYFSSL